MEKQELFAATIMGGIKEGLAPILSEIIRKGIESEDLAKLIAKTVSAAIKAEEKGASSLVSPRISKSITGDLERPNEQVQKTRAALSYPPESENGELKVAIEGVEDLVFAGRLGSALTEIEKLKGKYPNKTDVYIMESKWHSAQGFLKEAEERLIAAEKMDRKNSEIYFTRAQLNISRGNFEEAREQCEQAIQLRLNDPRYLNRLGFILWQLGEIDEAIKVTESASKLKIQDPAVKLFVDNNLAYYYAQRGRIEDIDRAFSLAEKLIEELKEVQRGERPRDKELLGDKQYQTKGYVYLRVYEIREKKNAWLHKAIKSFKISLDISNDKNFYSLRALKKAIDYLPNGT